MSNSDGSPDTSPPLLGLLRSDLETPLVTNQPRTLTGYIASAGTITAGTGFTCNRTGTGVFAITFTTPFTIAPTVVATLVRNGTAFITVQSAPSTTLVTFLVSDVSFSPLNNDFLFIAMTTV